MSVIKLFRTAPGPGTATELQAKSVDIEKKLQNLMETNLEAFLGVRLLASEYVTGKAHGGRIDTLGIDELGAPTIIEYKRSLNENVINQGLFYLDWLLDHKGEFEILTQKRFGSITIDWVNPRLLCVAADFTKYDEHAVQQIDRNISLIRYKMFGEDLVILELINVTTSKTSSGLSYQKPSGKVSSDPTVEQLLGAANPELSARFHTVRDYLLSLGDDVQMKVLKKYFAFTRLKNFACVEVHPKVGKILVYLKVNPDTLVLENGFTRDVRQIGHFGTGGLEVTVTSDNDVDRAKDLILRSYEDG